MKKSILILACIALVVAGAVLVWTASATCSTCSKEADWTESANNFLEGKPINEVAPEFGPKAVRKTESQFSKSASTEASTASADTSGSAAAADAAKLELKSIEASPSPVPAGSSTTINANFMQNGNESASENFLLTASATVKNSLGADVGKFNLRRSTGSEYSGSWKANVAPGLYNVTLAASSLQVSENFDNALQIEVVSASAGNETNSTAAEVPIAEKLG
ncbi:Uncharacterised protein [uncultured archaeon]|nr:Uncharacterised protein [uncultured archaeon]